jgi:F-type H+-transporting ATPase subunit delta
MPLLNSLATPYAEALLQVTEARDESQTVAEQCKQLLSVWDSSAEFRDAMVSPVLEPSSKKKALQGLLAEQVLADRQRLQAFEAVMNRFLELYREQQGITLAQVRSAKPLSEAQQAALSKKVQAMAGTSKVDIDLSVDPALIGGFVVSLGSQVIDASLAGQVRRLGLALAKAS